MSSPLCILASASPRRRQLLSQLTVPFTVIPADIDEHLYAGEAPEPYVRRIAAAKAQHLAHRYPTAVVLGADTIVVLDEQIIGKPRDADEARQILGRLSGRQHTVMTGIAVRCQERQVAYDTVVRTRVSFRALSPEEIDGYIATGEPFDKAGAYAVQGAGGVLVDAIDGCYSNVVGLPVQRTASLLRAAGLVIPERG